MSKTSVMDKFFTDAEIFLKENSLLDQPSRVYNIDETWDNPTQEKHKKVVVDNHTRISYKVFGGTTEHVTFTIGASANGVFLPPMVTFKSLPMSSSFHGEGPENALYSESHSGHTDSELYLRYITHIEPFLNHERPVIIYQDNLGAHENLRLIQFCLAKGIFLYNFPSKTSHLLQPMDKLFWKLKENVQIQKEKAKMLHNGFVAKAKIPIILRYAMNAMSPHDIKAAFSTTGIYPLERTKITPDKLIGDRDVRPPSDQSAADVTSVASTTVFSPGHTGSVIMGVYDETGQDINQASTVTKRCIATQTERIKSLPCSNCVENDVSLHPAVTEGYVDVAFAAAFIDSVSSTSSSTKKRKLSRDTSHGRCLTHHSEVERLTKIDTERKEKERASVARKTAIEQRKKDKIEAEKRKNQLEIEAGKRKERLVAQEELAKIGRLSRKRCEKCRMKPMSKDICQCVLSHCNAMYHKQCMPDYQEAESVGFAIICSLCSYLANE